MFAGVFGFSNSNQAPQAVDARAVSEALAPFHRPDIEGHWQHRDDWLLAQRVFNDSPNRDLELPQRCKRSGVVAAFWGRLDNRAELIEKLVVKHEIVGQCTDSQLILSCWHEWGEAMPEQLLGDFALSVIDPAGGQAFLARDAVGTKPLYYRAQTGELSFATALPGLLAANVGTAEPDMDWLARFIADVPKDNQATAYHNIFKLPPGYCLSVDRKGRQRLRRWHQWHDDAPDAGQRDPVWVDKYREKLEEAVRCRMGSDYPLGAENSGGLDSGSITAYLAHFLGEPGDGLHCFGYALCDQEPEYILQTSIDKNILHNHIVAGIEYLTPDDRLRGLKVLGYPEEIAVGTTNNRFYRECQLHGIRTLFSGFGGDEVVTSHAGALGREFLDARRYQQYMAITPGNWLTKPLRLAKAVMTGRHAPGQEQGNLEAWNALWPHQILSQQTVQRLHIRERSMQAARYDAPYRRVNDFILQYLLEQPYISARLEAGTLAAASWGVEYRWPLWDTRLVQQYLSTPSIEKKGPQGESRYLHRRAVHAVTPENVAWKSGKDMGAAGFLARRKAIGLKTLTEQIREQEANLHPAIVEMIDREKLRQQIRRASKKELADAEFAQFFSNVNALCWANHWLHGDAKP